MNNHNEQHKLYSWHTGKNWSSYLEGECRNYKNLLQFVQSEGVNLSLIDLHALDLLYSFNTKSHKSIILMTLVWRLSGRIVIVKKPRLMLNINTEMEQMYIGKVSVVIHVTSVRKQ